VKVNVRLVSATNRSLEDAVAKGTFRADLYFRLKVVTLVLPGLRERREDIVPLVDHFRKLFSRRHHKQVKGISTAVSRALYGYDWPGNVRQLRNAVETMVVLDSDGILDVDDLPPEMAEPFESTASASPVATANSLSELVGQPMEAYERFAIEETLKLTNGNRDEAARILDIGARTLYRKLDRYKM
jgi:two-component system response regulator HydG